MNTKKIYDAVVFDMDGVIFDSERAVMSLIFVDVIGVSSVDFAN